MKIKEESIRWAINHLKLEKDTDLFPVPKEINIFHDLKEKLIMELKNYDITQHKFGASRRFVIPKTELSYRIATQLEPMDSLLISAIIFEYGHQIEKRRSPKTQENVFSYRFDPEQDGTFYSNENSWKEFWSSCLQRSKEKKFVVQMDISDFYNQIYHHTIENQLRESNLPNQITKFIMGLLEGITKTVSRGIPIGPHFSHLIAEMTLIPIDDSLSMRGIDFCRYADDIYIFCNSEKEALITVYKMAEILDKQQKLVLQKQKTAIIKSEDFMVICDDMINDNSMDDNEDKMIETLKKYTTGFYRGIDFKHLTPKHQDLFSDERIVKVLEKYLSVSEPDYKKLRWLYRRLGQIGAPGGIDFTIKNMNKLMPAISDVCHYLIAAIKNFKGDFLSLGENVLSMLDDELIQANEYFYIAILDLFASNADLDHFKRLLPLYRHASSEAKREIILSAYQANASTWIRELKELFSTLDPWSKSAMLIACRILPEDEKKHYLNHIKKTHELSLSEKVILDWSINYKKEK